MKRVRCGLIGAGFVGPDHIDAIRRLGFVDIVTIAMSGIESVRRKAGTPRAQSVWFLGKPLDDPEIEVVDIATPKQYHFPMSCADR